MNRFFLWLKNEIRRVLPVFIFFFLSFFIVSQTETFLLKKAGLRPFSLLDVLIAAALVAKIFLVIDHLPIDSAFSKKPLIYPVLIKTVFYWAAAFLVRLAILFFPYAFLKEGFVLDWEAFNARMNWHLAASVQVWYLMLFLLFVSFRELSRAIGREKMRKIFFGRR